MADKSKGQGKPRQSEPQRNRGTDPKQDRPASDETSEKSSHDETREDEQVG